MISKKNNILLKGYQISVSGNNVYFQMEAGKSSLYESQNLKHLEIIKILDGTYDEEDIQNLIRRNKNKHELGAFFRWLDQNKMLMLTDEQENIHERYYNNLNFFESFSTLKDSCGDYQKMLEASRVVLVGTGGVGSTVLMNLLGLGIGTIVLIDFDTVEQKNLNRQFLYEESDVGKSKIEVASKKARNNNPSINIIGINKKINGPDDFKDAIQNSDVVVLTADTPSEIQMWANAACVDLGITLIIGGMQATQALFYSLDPHTTGCLACWRSASDGHTTGEIIRPLVIKNRAIGPAVSQLGGAMALEAVKYITNISPPISGGKVWCIDFVTGETKIISKWHKNEYCSVCKGMTAQNHSVHTSSSTRLSEQIFLTDFEYVKQDDHYVISAKNGEIRFALPEIGLAVLNGLKSGLTPQEVQKHVLSEFNEEIDTSDFLENLEELGMIELDQQSKYHMQHKKTSSQIFFDMIPVSILKLIYHPFSWSMYAVCALISLYCLAFIPYIRPLPHHLAFHSSLTVSVITAAILSFVFLIVHEISHYLAARATGIEARFSFGHRFLFPVAEVDLSNLWLKEKRHRYSPIMAGLANDTCILFIAIVIKLMWYFGIGDISGTIYRISGLVILLQSISISWQLLIFLRTDLYLIIVNIFNCFNLYEISWIRLKSALRLISRDESKKFENAHINDITASRWFIIILLLGVLWTIIFLIKIMIPSSLIMLKWTINTLQSGSIWSFDFWGSLIIALMAVLRMTTPIFIGFKLLAERISKKRVQKLA